MVRADIASFLSGMKWMDRIGCCMRDADIFGGKTPIVFDNARIVEQTSMMNSST